MIEGKWFAKTEFDFDEHRDEQEYMFCVVGQMRTYLVHQIEKWFVGSFLRRKEFETPQDGRYILSVEMHYKITKETEESK